MFRTFLIDSSIRVHERHHVRPWPCSIRGWNRFDWYWKCKWNFSSPFFNSKKWISSRNFHSANRTAVDKIDSNEWRSLVHGLTEQIERDTTGPNHCPANHIRRKARNSRWKTDEISARAISDVPSDQNTATQFQRHRWQPIDKQILLEEIQSCGPIDYEQILCIVSGGWSHEISAAFGAREFPGKQFEIGIWYKIRPFAHG